VVVEGVELFVLAVGKEVELFDSYQLVFEEYLVEELYMVEDLFDFLN
jgi:hypothetical protein